MPVLTILSTPGDGAGRELQLTDASIVIGRDKTSALVVDDPAVSRRHISVEPEHDQWVLRDLGSRRGTVVADQALTAAHTLADGDVVVIGHTKLRFAAATPAAPATPPAARQTADQPPVIRHQAALYSAAMCAFRKEVHQTILERMNVDADSLSPAAARAKITTELERILRVSEHRLDGLPAAVVQESLLDDFVGYGPISPFLREPDIEEIMVNGPSRIFIARAGSMEETQARFLDNAHVVNIIQRIVDPIGEHIDEAMPMVDARLEDGSRVNAIIPPLALNGPTLTIRKFSDRRLTTDDLVHRFGSITPPMAQFLEEAVRARQNILVSGGTGSGKTTLLNVLSQFIPNGERIVTIEDTAELRLDQRNLVTLQARRANIEGRGEVAIRDLVINSLRMRPDRIIVGECRGSEAFDMLQAMNTGHDGSLTTVHANSARDALVRLENMVMMAVELPSTVIREQISSGIDLVVQQSRLADGTRKVVQITEITGREKDVILTQDIFAFTRTGHSDDGRVVGTHGATGNVPRFVQELQEMGDLRVPLSLFQEEPGR
jgi:pilus assembly protein CpaF